MRIASMASRSYGVKNFRAEGLTLTQAGGSCVKVRGWCPDSLATALIVVVSMT